VVKAAFARAITAALSSATLRGARRRFHGLPRVLRRAPATVHYFHDAADPYSYLAAQLLPRLGERYRIDLIPHLVPPPDEGGAPDAARLAAWGCRDAALLARAHGLAFPAETTAAEPDLARHLSAVLTRALAREEFVPFAIAAGRDFWDVDLAARLRVAALPAATQADTATALQKGAILRRKLGHYLGATFYCEGEWYWGCDRLHYLEARMAGLGLDRAAGQPMLAPVRDVALAPPRDQALGHVLHLFLSFRSPYSYLAVPRAIALARHYGAELRLRFVLPMVMRGLKVPWAKRRYIVFDAKREAERLGLRFGRIVDPVGPGVERGLAVLHQAIEAGQGATFAQSFLQGVFADGIDAVSDVGLRQMAARAGVSAGLVRQALEDDSWHAVAEANREEMLAAGLWGVPCLRVDDGPMLWGQDRLWAIEETLRGLSSK
jgi:2-hydroxychromene-2-carboxylate isomerase